MANVPTSNAWFVLSKASGNVRLRLFCLPYAGGSASIFQSWAGHLPSHIQVCALQLPGRQSRLLEPPLGRLQPLVQILGEAIRPLLDAPFAVFGHSMGALVGFELLRHLRRQAGLSALHLFASGGHAPHLPKPGPPLHALPEQAFVAALYRLNALPAEAFQSPELLRLLLPALRADISLCETYAYTPDAPLDCPITAFGGLQDYRVRPFELDAWRYQTSVAFKLRLLPGDHFFIERARPLLLRAISEDLASV